MKITIARGENSQPPQGELTSGALVWEGEDGQEKDTLPGSLCKDLARDFDVGVWQRFDEVRDALQTRAPEAGALASIRVVAQLGEGEAGPSIRIPHEAAAHAMLSAAIALSVTLRSSTKELWIRVV